MKPVRTVAAWRRTGVAALLACASAWVQAGDFDCFNGTFSGCAQATSHLSWTWDGLDFTIASTEGGGYVSEVYFDLGGGMSAAFLGGTGDVLFYEPDPVEKTKVSPGSLPGGNEIGFTSDAAFDSDAPTQPHLGIDPGETATFRISGANLDSFDIGAIAAGLRVRSLGAESASLVTITTPVPEPETYAMMLLGFGVVAWSARQRRKH